MKTPPPFFTVLVVFLVHSRCLILALCIATLAFSELPSGAAVTEAWVQRYNSGNLVSNSQDVALAVVRDGLGNIIVTGKSDGCDGDILTIKYSGVAGSVLWEQRYTAPDCGEGTPCCRNCSLQPSGIAVDRSGNVLVAAGIGGGSAGGYAYAAKYAAADGALLWEQKRHDGGGFPASSVDADGNVILVGGLNITKYASADGAILWEHRHTNAVARAVTVDGSGNVIVVGYFYAVQTTDYYTAKYAAATGSLLWEKRYSGPADGHEGAAAVGVDGDGNVIVTGASESADDNEQMFRTTDIYTVKYAATDGALLWEKRYNGPANSSDVASSLAVDGSGNVLITGSSHASTIDKDVDLYTAKYAAGDGALLWEKRHSGSSSTWNRARAIALDSSGNAIVTGTSHDSEVAEPLVAEYYTVKYASADGAPLWERRSEGYTWGCDYGAFDHSPAMTVDSNGDVVVTGSLKANYYTGKYSASDGAILWEGGYDGPPNKLNDEATEVAIDRGGNVLVTGSSFNANGDQDFYTAKYAPGNGALLWEKRYNAPGNHDERSAHLAVDHHANVIVAGSSISGATSGGYYTAKYSSADGALLWERRSDGPTNCWGEVAAVALDARGNVVLTGTFYNNATELQTAGYYTVKFAAENGVLLWEKGSQRPTNNWRSARAVAVDGNGDVVVTGLAEGPVGASGHYDYYTVKYAASNGALLWEKRYDGGSDYASAVAVDDRGNVVVTGYSYPSRETHADFYTAKYAAVDGTLIWERRYAGPQEDRAYALAVDPNGNVVVAGYSGNTDKADIYTVKYAAADGALLWEKRHAGTYIGDQQAQVAMKVDGIGNVVVAGSCRNSSGNNDYYTAKYAAANGALLWEKSYNGPANGEEIVRSSHSLALGPNGIVAVTGSSDADFRSRKASDYATVVYWEDLPSVSATLIPTGIRIRSPGVLGRSYAVQRARGVTGPWSTIATAIAATDGNIEYVDATALTTSMFYRIFIPE